MSSTPHQPPTLHGFGLDAAWLATRIEESPILLGLTTGMPTFERTVPRPAHDQFAVILFDPADGVRIIAEVQLGDADQAQVERALRHWESERTRLPVEHRVAIAAEHIPADVLEAAARAQATARLAVVELHAERIGNIVAVNGEPVQLPTAGS